MAESDHPANNPADLTPEEELEQNPDQMKLPGGDGKTKKPRFSGAKKSRAVKKALLILLILLLLGAAGFAVWKYFIEPGGETSVDTAGQSESAQEQTSDIAETPLTETYSSEELRLDFKYPADWIVSEGAGGIRIESPEFTYQTESGETKGLFRLYIRKGARDADSKYIGRGVAIAPSEGLSYQDPLPGQRKDTLLSAFGLDTPDSFNFFLVAGNFDLKKGDTLGPDFGKEADAYIIAGGFTDNDNSEDLQMNSVRTDQYNQSSAYKQAVQIIKSLQLR